MSSATTASGSTRPHHVAVRQYKPHEVYRGLLAQRSVEVLEKNPFEWQLDACASILCGQDVILDVGTGNGKTLVFSLPLLTDPKDVNIIVSPLSALMIDQVNLLSSMYILVLILNKACSSTLPTAAVCSETITEAGSKERLFEVCCSFISQTLLLTYSLEYRFRQLSAGHCIPRDRNFGSIPSRGSIQD